MCNEIKCVATLHASIPTILDSPLLTYGRLTDGHRERIGFPRCIANKCAATTLDLSSLDLIARVRADSRKIGSSLRACRRAGDSGLVSRGTNG